VEGEEPSKGAAACQARTGAESQKAAGLFFGWWLFTHLFFFPWHGPRGFEKQERE